jgi:hypothetical protein
VHEVERLLARIHHSELVFDSSTWSCCSIIASEVIVVRSTRRLSATQVTYKFAQRDRDVQHAHVRFRRRRNFTYRDV